MSRELPHRVRRLQWEVEASSTDDALAVRRVLSEQGAALAAALDQEFSAHDGSGLVRRIPKVELRLGAMTLAGLDADLLERVSSALRQTLAVESAAEAHSLRSNLRSAWLHYLDTGCMHWSLAGLEPDEARASLEAAAVEAAEDWLAGTAELPARESSSFAARVAALARWLALLPRPLGDRLGQRAREGAARASLSALESTTFDTMAGVIEWRALQLALCAEPSVPLATIRAWLDDRRSVLNPRSPLGREALPTAAGEVELARRLEPEFSRGETAPAAADGGLLVPLAGLVLLHPYLPRLFAQLQLYDVGSRGKMTPAALHRALALMHWLATGRDDAEEYELPLVKLLLGLPPDKPLVFRPEPPSSVEREECDSLLSAVVGHWKALRNTGIDALRTSFLQRRGLLARRDGVWHLHMQGASFDLLLAHLPWSVSWIQLPWSDAPLFVEWRAP